MLSIRNMVPDDIEAGLRLCRQSGWNQVTEDWALFLRISPSGCRVAERNGYVIGTAATLPYQTAFTWISMVLVDSRERRQGVGTRLLTEALKILPDDACARLDATPAGRTVYLQHGFQDEHPLARMTRTAGSLHCPLDTTLRPIEAGDWPTILARDKLVFGADRSEVLASLYRRAPQFAWIAGTNELEGYCLGRSGHLYDQVGPIVANSARTAINLTSACLGKVARACVVDASLHSTFWLEWLARAGFSEERTLIRMRRGGPRISDRPTSVFAIAGPELG